jgi:hypothetical protein
MILNGRWSHCAHSLMDRASDFGSDGWGFDSLWAHKDRGCGKHMKRVLSIEGTSMSQKDIQYGNSLHMKFLLILTLFVFSVILSLPAFSQNYPDQQYVLKLDSLCQQIESSDGVTVANDGHSLVLSPDRIDGFAIIKSQYSAYPFNQGLPSWNGASPDTLSAFKIQMRFPLGTGWSRWMTVGYWKVNMWISYGYTTFDSGKVDVDYVTLTSYVSAWQFKIIMNRSSVIQASPAVRKLSFYVSDSRTTSSYDFTQVLNDNPSAIFIPTNFVYQYGVDPEIGGSICSPTSVSMILKSYNIAVDPLNFARATYDPYYGIFGGWPRVVQNASQYGLDGAVTRYRTWSEASAVLAKGGRIAMSVAKPLYTGHLIMLAGFTSGGVPIVHDPARSDGYSHIFSKSDLSHSWFDKGGFAYTFYPAESGVDGVKEPAAHGTIADGIQLYQNYPNPFNPVTNIGYTVGVVSGQSPAAIMVKLAVYDLLGREVGVLVNDVREPGLYSVTWNASHMASGVYYYVLRVGTNTVSRSMVLMR